MAKVPRKSIAQAPPGAPKRTRVRRIADRELTREDWIGIARKALIEEGIAAVRIERLAKSLGVTRGGFYWRFKNQEDLLNALLEDWTVNNSKALLAALKGPGDLSQRFDAVVDIWVGEKNFSPAWDSAVRDWARISAAVAEAVHAVDDERIAAFQAMFAQAGCPPKVALVRARIVYYHQVGYYALGVRDARARRKSLLGIYKAVLTGIDPEGLLKPAGISAATTLKPATAQRAAAPARRG